MRELPPYTAQLLERYEKQIEPEARFVRFVDKMLPAIINVLAGDADTSLQDYNITSLEMLMANRDAYIEKCLVTYSEFQFIVHVCDEIYHTSGKIVFDNKK